MAENIVKDESADKTHFTITPRIVWATCKDVYEYTLWNVVKGVAGDNGECYISTENLAILAMMSTGKVSKSRKRLLDVGLLSGEMKKVDNGQTVWHLSVPNLWPANIEFVAEYSSISKRVEYKKKQSLHHMKPSPHEGKPSPHETKKIHQEDPSLPQTLFAVTAEKTYETVEVVSEEDLEELEYVDLEEEEETQRPKWQIPDTPEQKEMLALAGRKWFQSGEKAKTKALIKAFNAGDLLGDTVYRQCVDALRDVPSLEGRRICAIPRSWLEYRAEHAKRNRWSYGGLLKALYDRDKLVEHCQYKLREMGDKGGGPTITHEDGKVILNYDDTPTAGQPRVEIENGVRVLYYD